jgi:hypothetical protein
MKESESSRVKKKSLKVTGTFYKVVKASILQILIMTIKFFIMQNMK